MRSFQTLLALTALGAGCLAATQANAAELCKPTIEGPVASTAEQPIYRRVVAPPAGYVEEEYFISCTASAGPYKTVLEIRRPADPKNFSGVVMVEAWHADDIWPSHLKLKDYEYRAGHAIAVVEGNPAIVARILKASDSNKQRYAALQVPKGDLTEGEILAQAGALIKQGGVPGLKPKYLILGGMSATGVVVRDYITHEHATALVDGKPVYDGYFPEQSAISWTVAPIPDLNVPVVELQGESELVRHFGSGGHDAAYRRADGPLYRLYEIPGLSHIATRDDLEKPGDWNCGHTPLTNFPTAMVYQATLADLIAWVTKGVPAPHAPRIETNAKGDVVTRDAYDNAKGGLRTSYFDVPIATYHATAGLAPMDRGGPRCDMLGWYQMLPHDQLLSLYPTHAAYVARVDAELKKLVAGRWLLPQDASTLRAEAEQAAIP